MAAPSERALKALATRLGRALLVRQQRIATAESCTGGWIAKVVTDIPGSSQWFGAGFVTYSNEAKTHLLGVPEALIEAHGAVSEPVVRAMADAARARAAAEVAVAVSGIAGPEGGTADKPVGTVWFAWSAANGTHAEVCRYAGDRDTVRRASVEHALEGLLAQLWGDERPE
jgi:nicotinamide-nucleotide amidase